MPPGINKERAIAAQFPKTAEPALEEKIAVFGDSTLRLRRFKTSRHQFRNAENPI
jgi:hypothetical protein